MHKISSEKVNELTGKSDLVEFNPIEKELIVYGYPGGDDEPDEVCWEFHDCDAMGCSSVGPHILFRFNWIDGIASWPDRVETEAPHA